MPARHYVLAILLLWGATMAWFFYRDIRPLFFSGEPLPFTINLDEEAEEQGKGHELYWTVFQKGQDKGYAKTWTEYQRKDDTFEMSGIYKFWSGGRSQGAGKGGPGEPDQEIESLYRITREGELRRIQTRVAVTVQKVKVTAALKGQVIDHRFLPQLQVLMPAPFGVVNQNLDPVEISARGSVLNPMMPLNRLVGLHRGQHWRMPLVDPLDDVWRAVAAKYKFPIEVAGNPSGIRFLDAHVLSEAEDLQWGGEPDPIRCLVIEYHGGDFSGRTWVQESTGLVMQQEAARGEDTLTLVRLDPAAPVPE